MGFEFELEFQIELEFEFEFEFEFVLQFEFTCALDVERSRFLSPAGSRLALWGAELTLDIELRFEFE